MYRLLKTDGAINFRVIWNFFLGIVNIQTYMWQLDSLHISNENSVTNKTIVLGK